MANKSKSVTYTHDCKASIGGTTMYVRSSNLGKKFVEKFEPSAQGMIGTSKPANTGRLNLKEDVSGDVVVMPSYAHANTLLGLVFDEDTGTFSPADSPNALDIDVVLDKSVDVYTYADCFPASLTVAGSENQPLLWTLSLLGGDETDAGSVDALTVPDVMRFSDLTCSINSNTYFPTGFEWVFSYDYEERFHQSVTRSSVSSKIPRCDLTLNFDVNSDTWADLLDNAGTDTTVDSVSCAFTDGVNTVTFELDETTNENEMKLPEAGESGALDGTVSLRAWLKSGNTDIMNVTYA